MAGIEKRFIDEFTKRVTDIDDRFQRLDNRVRKIEKYLVKGSICTVCKDYRRRSVEHAFDKMLYCDKCDKLHCYMHYCSHLEQFIENH